MQSFNLPIFQSFNRNNGQSLIEVLIGMSIGAILIGAAAASTVFVLRSNYDVKTTQIASSLADEYIGNINSLVLSDWQKIYTPPAGKGADSQFYLTASGTTFVLVSGVTTTVVEGKNFTRYFSIENVSRNLCGAGDISINATTSCAQIGDSGIADDPSTQKITVNAQWEGGRSLNKIQYLTRIQNKVFIQTDWSGGANQEFFATSTNNTSVNSKFATSTNNINYSSSTGAITIYFGGGGGASTSTPPLNLTANAVSSSTINLSWSVPSSDGGSAITNYKIYRSTSTNPTILINTINATTTYSNSGLIADTTYYYRVKAVNGIGDSDYSNEASTMTLGPITFNYIGSQQTWVVPTGITSIGVDVKGARGGRANNCGSGTAYGGLGARVQSTLSVVPGETLYIYIGQKPVDSSSSGGWNGGGNGGVGGCPGGGGGGASDIRQSGTALSNRVVVAGGGGGGAHEVLSGGDGGYDGASGGWLWGAAAAGGGGTQSTGGSGGIGGHANGTNGDLGIGGSMSGSVTNYAGGGGGGGYYGGGGGGGSNYGDWPWGAGGGGSSWTSGSNPIYTTGYQTGDGQIIISY